MGRSEHEICFGIIRPDGDGLLSEPERLIMMAEPAMNVRQVVVCVDIHGVDFNSPLESLDFFYQTAERIVFQTEQDVSLGVARREVDGTFKSGDGVFSPTQTRVRTAQPTPCFAIARRLRDDALENRNRFFVIALFVKSESFDECVFL